MPFLDLSATTAPDTPLSADQVYAFETIWTIWETAGRQPCVSLSYSTTDNAIEYGRRKGLLTLDEARRISDTLYRTPSNWCSYVSGQWQTQQALQDLAV